MSKASLWVERCKEARAASPMPFYYPPVKEKEERVPGRFVAEVNAFTGGLNIGDKQLPPDEALKLAAWIAETFGT